MKPANPATAQDTKVPDQRYFGKIIDGPHAGTFARVGHTLIRRIGNTDYKRFEEPAGSGKYVWRLRPTESFHKPETPWDMAPPYVERKPTKKQSTNSQE